VLLPLVSTRIHGHSGFIQQSEWQHRHTALAAGHHLSRDDVAQRSLGVMQRFRRVAFDQIERVQQEQPWSWKTSLSSAISDFLRKTILRCADHSCAWSPFPRSDFSEPRLDGAVYAYLPPQTPPALIERMIDNAVDHIQLLANRREITERLTGATREIRNSTTLARRSPPNTIPASCWN